MFLVLLIIIIIPPPAYYFTLVLYCYIIITQGPAMVILSLKENKK